MLTGKSTLRVLLLTLVAASLLPAQPARYAVYLEDQPVVTAQAVARDLVARNFRITGSSSLLLNAIFVSANGARIDELRALPGVAGVVRLLPHHRALSKAVQLVNGPGTAAFNAAGALPNGGQGVKIAILDTGIDQNHPSLRDSGVEAPGGFLPVCDPSGRLFGLMPHPDAYLYPFHHPQWTKRKLGGTTATEGDGLKIFRNGARAARDAR